MEWTLNVGTVAALFFAIAGFYWVTKSDMRVMKENVVAIKAELKVLTDVMQNVAIQKSAIDHHTSLITSQSALISVMEERIFKLSQGRGFIQKDIDGEYPR